MDFSDEYSQIHQNDLRVYNKLILSRKLGSLYPNPTFLLSDHV
jgi:hypothetical protein